MKHNAEVIDLRGNVAPPPFEAAIPTQSEVDTIRAHLALRRYRGNEHKREGEQVSFERLELASL